jgi:hypothetical protein
VCDALPSAPIDNINARIKGRSMAQAKCKIVPEPPDAPVAAPPRGGGVALATDPSKIGGTCSFPCEGVVAPARSYTQKFEGGRESLKIDEASHTKRSASFDTVKDGSVVGGAFISASDMITANSCNI